MAFEAENPPIVSFEVKPWGDEDPDVIVQTPKSSKKSMAKSKSKTCTSELVDSEYEQVKTSCMIMKRWKS